MSTLRETIAKVMLATETTNTWESLSIMYYRYGSQEDWLEQADAAIAAFSTALLSDTAVEAGAKAHDVWEVDDVWTVIQCRNASRQVLTAALAAVTEGGQGE